MKLNHTNTMETEKPPIAPWSYYDPVPISDLPDPAPGKTLYWHKPSGDWWDRPLSGTFWCAVPKPCVVAIDPSFAKLLHTEPSEEMDADAFERSLSSYNQTANTMKDNDKPEAPEGYAVMLGQDLRGKIPPGMLCRTIGRKTWQPWGTDPHQTFGAYEWYAVPNPPPDTDPKASQAIQKPQLQLIPPALNEETAKALMRGAEKYGFFNWRGNKVEMMTYLGAMKRHIDRLIEGEDIDPDTGAHHLGCVAAGCGIVLDARKHGTLVDNRPPKGQID